MKYGILLKVSDKGEKPVVMSIGKFYDVSEKYLPKIVTRFKGLGEMQPDDLRYTTIDPRYRVLIQLKTEDFEKEMDIFHKLNGPSKKDAERRKKMMKEYRIKREDLDN